MGGWCSLNLSHANVLFLECNEKIEKTYIRGPYSHEELELFKLYKYFDDVKSASKCRELCLSTSGCNVMWYWEDVSSDASDNCLLFGIEGNAKDFLVQDFDDPASPFSVLLGHNHYRNLVTYFCSGP